METRSRVIKMLRRVHGESEGSSTEVDDLISRLDKSSYVNRALNIARLTPLWKEHFHDHPSHKEVATLLLGMGKQQQWFISTDKSTSSTLTLIPSPVRSRHVGFADNEDDGKADTETSSSAALEEELDEPLHNLHINADIH